MCSIRYEEDRHRSAAYDGGKMVGECYYRRDGRVWVIDHTQIETDYLKEGAADKLVQCVVEKAREEGAIVVPICIYAAGWFRRNTAFRDVL